MWTLDLLYVSKDTVILNGKVDSGWAKLLDAYDELSNLDGLERLKSLLIQRKAEDTVNFDRILKDRVYW